MNIERGRHQSHRKSSESCACSNQIMTVGHQVIRTAKKKTWTQMSPDSLLIICIPNVFCIYPAPLSFVSFFNQQTTCVYIGSLSSSAEATANFNCRKGEKQKSSFRERERERWKEVAVPARRAQRGGKMTSIMQFIRFLMGILLM